MSLVLITGTPGAGKTLLATWELARTVPGSSIEQGGVSVPRQLFSNIRDLLVDHTHIDAKDLESWHTWAKPGDVIIFDEVQEVWRPRGLGVKVPPEIAALETHRHMGVDLVLITQHPMLVDPNIRRLVNQHLHLRRITVGTAMVYEWDHCENPSQTKGVISHRLFFHRKKMYGLYKSAQLHTKPKVRLPTAVWVLLALAGVMAYAGPSTYDRITSKWKAPAEPVKTAQVASKPVSAPVPLPVPLPALPAVVPAALVASSPKLALAGCGIRASVCRCYDGDGQRMEVDPGACEKKIPDAPALDFKEWALSASVADFSQPAVAAVSVAGDIEVLSFMRGRQ